MLKGFKCNRCGKCCYPPRLYSKDIKRIKRAGYSEESFIERSIGNIPYLKEQKNGKCAFLKQNQKSSSCKIYDCRPKICRLYPTRLLNGSCEPEKLAFDSIISKTCN